MKIMKTIPLLTTALFLIACSAQSNNRKLEIHENPQVFDLKNKIVRLNSGYDMPIVGLGTYALSHDECVISVSALLENGGRLIDTASFYGTDVICCEL